MSLSLIKKSLPFQNIYMKVSFKLPYFCFDSCFQMKKFFIMLSLKIKAKVRNITFSWKFSNSQFSSFMLVEATTVYTVFPKMKSEIEM